MIDLSALNTFVDLSTVTVTSSSLQKGDLMFSIDLKDVSFQVRMHSESIHTTYLCFVVSHQLKDLCFGFSPAS